MCDLVSLQITSKQVELAIQEPSRHSTSIHIIIIIINITITTIAIIITTITLSCQVSNLVLLGLTIAHLMKAPDGAGTKRFQSPSSSSS